MAYMQSGKRVLLFGLVIYPFWFVGTLVPNNDNWVQNVVQTCQSERTIKYNRLTQNIIEWLLLWLFHDPVTDVLTSQTDVREIVDHDHDLSTFFENVDIQMKRLLIYLTC